MEGKERSLYRAFLLYGRLLTDKQREMFEDYFGLDLSLGEIAELRGVSRQAVKDSLSHTERQLEYYEERLGLCARNDRIEEMISDSAISEELKNKIEDLLEGR